MRVKVNLPLTCMVPVSSLSFSLEVLGIGSNQAQGTQRIGGDCPNRKDSLHRITVRKGSERLNDFHYIPTWCQALG
jgi:hypothetical protein